MADMYLCHHTNSHSLPRPQARMAMADVYLRHRKDKTSYIKCYLDLVVRGMGGVMPR